MNILKKIKFTFDLINAFEYDSKQNYKKVIETLSPYLKDIIGKEEIIPEYFILYAEALARLQNNKEAEKMFINIFKSIDDAKKLSQDEIKYLKTYIYEWLKYLNEDLIKNIEKKTFYYNFNYDNVRKSLKINFDHQFIWG